MATDKREGWLKDLKAGDRVAVDGYGFRLRDDLYLGRVDRVTPAGNIFVILDGNTSAFQFRHTGRLKTDGMWDSHTLVQYTPAIEEQIQHQREHARVSTYLDFGTVSREKLEALSTQQLRDLYNILSPLKR